MYELTFGFARLDAFRPRVRKLVANFFCALLEPSAAETAATGFAVVEGATFGTFRKHAGDGARGGRRRRVCFCGQACDSE